MTVLYGIPNCDSVKKARAWLNAQAVDYRFHDFKQQPPTGEQIDAWLQSIPLSVLLNKRGTTWRKLSAEQQAQAADPSAAAELMRQHPSLIKRPVLEHGDTLLCGFDAARYAELFEQAA